MLRMKPTGYIKRHEVVAALFFCRVNTSQNFRVWNNKQLNEQDLQLKFVFIE